MTNLAYNIVDNQPRRILIVDDEAGFTRLLKLTLEGTKRYIVKEENDGSQALSTARQFRPDLILLDIVMPKSRWRRRGAADRERSHPEVR